VAQGGGGVGRPGDPVGVEDPLHKRGGRHGVAEDHRDVPGRHALLEEREHARAHELQLRALAAGLEQEHGATRGDRLGAGLEQAALEVVEGGARGVRVVGGRRLEVLVPGGESQEAAGDGGDGAEGLPAGLERQRDDDGRADGPRERLD
jgi:hypothetical protein